MAIELVTGAARQAHVSSDDMAHLFAGIFGKDTYILDNVLPNLSFQNANTLQIPACDICVNGRHVRLTGTTSISIQSGSQTAHRRDLLCVKYIADRSSNIESVDLVVVAGKAVAKSTDLVDPQVPNKGNILDGAPEVYVPVAKIEVEDLTPTVAWLIGCGGHFVPLIKALQNTEVFEQDGVYVSRQGKTCFVDFQKEINLASAWATQNILTLPESLRPNHNINFKVVTSNKTANVGVSIGTDGLVKAWCAGGTTMGQQVVYGNAAYMTV